MRERIFSMPTDTAEQYFAVIVNNQTHITEARSDYHAAYKVKKETGYMASCEDDVLGPFSSRPRLA